MYRVFDARYHHEPSIKFAFEKRMLTGDYKKDNAIINRLTFHFLIRAA